MEGTKNSRGENRDMKRRKKDYPYTKEEANEWWEIRGKAGLVSRGKGSMKTSKRGVRIHLGRGSKAERRLTGSGWMEIKRKKKERFPTGGGPHLGGHTELSDR